MNNENKLEVITSNENKLNDLYNELRMVIYNPKYNKLNCATVLGIIGRTQYEYNQFWDERLKQNG